jgi:hypothetical protein
MATITGCVRGRSAVLLADVTRNGYVSYCFKINFIAASLMGRPPRAWLVAQRASAKQYDDPRYRFHGAAHSASMPNFAMALVTVAAGSTS